MSSAAIDWFYKEYRWILEKAGETVLKYAFQCGTDGKSPLLPLDEYLRNLPETSTTNYIRDIQEKMRKSDASQNRLKIHNKYLEKQFLKAELEQMRGDPSCDNFDITLLFKSIQFACENVADRSHAKWTTPSNEMEYLVWEIKTKRNYCIHTKTPVIHTDEEFHEEAEKVTDLFVRTLEATKTRYNRDESEFTGKKKEVLEAVENARKDVQQKAANDSLPHFKKETNTELQDSLENAKYLDPLHFLSGYEGNRVDVQTVFSSIDMISVKNRVPSGGDRKEQIDYLKLLQITQAVGPPSTTGAGQPQILLIEGDAGSGKTTLITFILSEWLKKESCRRMEGLDQYDLLIRIVCREENTPSLDDLLRQVLPESYITYGRYLLPLLKQCKVIFLIDGVDEMSDVSNKLVTDVLSEGKQCANFTIVCTSRPATLPEFKLKTPKNYRTSNVRMFGISPDERTHLAVKHYEWLTGGVAGDTDNLRQVMEEIGWMELFRLPLNILFLATVFHYEPTSVKSTLTQTQLYYLIHEWCIEKLLHRLETRNLRKNVDTVLKVAYQVALHGLLQHRIFLTREDKDLLSSSCSSQGLPENEVMQAFYTLQREVTYGVEKERYRVPHKGFQDFFAAQHIVDRPHGYKQGDIRRVLEDTAPGHEPRLESLGNMLCHLLGLLSRRDSPDAIAMKETVDLIKDSGLEYSRDWLSVLADAVPHPAVLERVAHHIKDRPGRKETIEITDSTVHAAAALLPLIPPCSIKVTAERTANAGDFRPALDRHKVVSMELQNHFVHPGSAATSGHLLHQFPRNNLETFRGHLNAEHLSQLPESLTDLSLVVAGNEHARSLLSPLSRIRKSLLKLTNLTIHIPVTSVTPDAITHPLPAGPNVCLILSGVSEEKAEAAWRVAASLCPSKKEYKVIRFPGASLTLDGWERVVQGLAGAGVRVRRGLRVPAAILTEGEARHLTTLTKTLLNAKESRRVQDYILWL